MSIVKKNRNDPGQKKNVRSSKRFNNGGFEKLPIFSASCQVGKWKGSYLYTYHEVAMKPKPTIMPMTASRRGSLDAISGMSILGSLDRLLSECFQNNPLVNWHLCLTLASYSA